MLRRSSPDRIFCLAFWLHRSLEASLVVHTLAFVWFARVWLWHLTPAAAVLPGAQGFGWFIRFLTFFSYTMQTVTLGIATADDWSKLVRGAGEDTAAAARPRR